MIRAFRPGARRDHRAARRRHDRRTSEQVHPGGVFEGTAEGAELPLRYRLEIDYGDAGSFTIEDPYAFAPTLGELDLHLIGEGRHEELYDRLGAHVREHQGVHGTAFAVWAPAARAVSVVGDFNSWDGRLHAMRSLGSGGIWELFLPGVEAGARYKYEILTADGELALKADPFAQETELPPKTASVVYGSQHEWRDARVAGDAAVSAAARAADLDLRGPPRLLAAQPLEGNRSLTYLELADELAAYVKDLGFTHVELLPVMAHPFSGSWGYQVTGYFAPTPALRLARRPARVRRPHARATGIGVILDWVPAHFPRDDLALARFDGTALYEHDGSAPRRAPRLGHAGLQLRAPRGPQLPDRQRAVLAARVPRRRDPRRRRGVDALPRLLAPRGRVGAERVRRPRGPRRGRVPQGAERGPLRPRAGHRLRRRGVDRLAGRLAPHLPRRASASASSGTWAGCTTRSATSSRSRSTAATTTTSSRSA